MAWVKSQNYDKSFIEFFYRDPDRVVPPGDNMVSPADGRLKRISKANGKTYFIVGLSLWDVHVVRTPVAGTVKSVEDEGFTIYKDESETKDNVFLLGKDAPVQKIVTLDTKYGEVKVRLITSYAASRLRSWAIPGAKIAKGARIGRMLLGSSVVVEMNGDVNFMGTPGQRLVGGETLILKGQSDK
jgi:phosphatidylserine decarboxylase